MSLLRPHYYWTEGRFDTTSNSQFPSVAPLQTRTPATRRDDDEYVRSVWSAQVSYTSDGTNSTFGWWTQAAVRLVVSWDPFNAASPSDVGDDDPLTLGYAELFPQRFQLDVSPHYSVVWAPVENNLKLRTARLGAGLGTLPGLIGSLWYYSQYGAWSGTFEASQIKRARITSRVLWASSSP